MKCDIKYDIYSLLVNEENIEIYYKCSTCCKFYIRSSGISFAKTS